MSSWVSALEQFAALDPTDFDPAALSDEQLRELIPLAQIGLNRLASMQTRTVATAEARSAHAGDGMVSMKSWLTGHCRISGREAATLVRDGRRLRQLPALASAYAAGAVTSAHVGVVTSAVTPARVAKAAEQGIDLGHTDEILTDAALTLGPEDTARAVRRWVAGIDPDGNLDDDAGLPRVFRMAASAGGRTYLSGHLDAVGAETVHTALEAVMNGHRPAGDRRSAAERRGAALVELCRQALHGDRLPDVRGQRPHVRVTVDWPTLSAARGVPGTGELPFAGPVSAETARRIACDAGVSRILIGPNSMPMDVGREQRTAPAAIRRGIELRDGHCVFTGCAAPPDWCDIHHVDHWAWGGETSCDNGALICERHHTAVHEGGFSVARDPGTSTWHTYRPDGTEIRIRGSSP
jgi:Domain of unknown function (DUF222)